MQQYTSSIAQTNKISNILCELRSYPEPLIKSKVGRFLIISFIRVLLINTHKIITEILNKIYPKKAKLEKDTLEALSVTRDQRDAAVSGKLKNEIVLRFNLQKSIACHLHKFQNRITQI